MQLKINMQLEINYNKTLQNKMNRMQLFYQNLIRIYFKEPKLQMKQKNSANKALQKALQVLIRKIKEGKDYETKIIYLEEKLNKTKEQIEQLNRIISRKDSNIKYLISKINKQKKTDKI